ncbi:MAG: DUF3137 domain-containing protein [Candidatus Omnitrophica bacterium]|nr:DUF3137 domain-containing protein [Candidatus Omnitrophota bacterium]
MFEKKEKHEQKKPIFRTSQDEVWEQLSREIQGRFIEGETSKGGKVTAKVGEWTVTLDLYCVDTHHNHIVYTRMRAPFVNKDGFRFLIYRQTYFTAIEKYFGLQDIETGNPDFDKNYVIQGNNEEKVKQLFSNAKIREIIHSLPVFYGQVRNDDGWFHEEFPEGVDELYCLVEEKLTDIKKLKDMFELFSEILNTLCHIGSAYEKDPNIDI